MTPNLGKYNMKAVTKILGIQAGTLRAWERRYQIIAPVRNDSGHRLYTEEHLSILKSLVQKVNQGFTISQAVALLDSSLPSVDSSSDPNENTDQIDKLSDDLLQALMNFEELSANELIDRAFSLYTIDKVIIDILGSLLVRIGDLWEQGKITSAHEHFATSILRSRISIIMNSFMTNPSLPKAIAVCGPGEWHEFGLLIFTLFLRRKGLEVIYLGPSIAEKDMENVIEIAHPGFIFFSCTMFDNLRATLKLAEKVQQQYPKIHIGVGGFAIETLPESEKAQYKEWVVGTRRNLWEQWLDARLTQTIY